jgi:hypothetical protein
MLRAENDFNGYRVSFGDEENILNLVVEETLGSPPLICFLPYEFAFSGHSL